MKLKSGVIVSQVGDGYVAVAAGESRKSFNGMIRLNDTAAFVVKLLKNPVTTEELTEAMCGKYDVSRDAAAESINRVIAKLREADLLE